MRTTLPILLAALGCGGGGQSPPDADVRQTVAEITTSRALDLLFVIDDSGGMADHQARLAQSFPVLVNELASQAGGLPDLHVGVISTDMGTKASGSASPAPPVGQIGAGGCAATGKGGNLTVNSAPVTGAFLSDIGQSDGTRVRNYTGDLVTAVSTMMRLGASGCGFEQPLAAMRAALDGNPSNAGFLRPEGLLAIVILTDEDDCSIRDVAMFGPDSAALGPRQSFRCTRFGVTCAIGGATPDDMNSVGVKDQCTASSASHLDDVAEFRNFLVALKADASNVFVASIMGSPDPVAVELRTINNTSQPALAHSCTLQTASGPLPSDPGVRLRTFVEGLQDRSAFTTICQDDFSPILQQVGGMLGSRFGAGCLTAPLAAEPDCIVEDIVAGTAVVLAECGAVPAAPCWRLVSDPAACAAGDQLRLEVVREVPPPPATVTRMRCVTR
jgi:hypothetical protein